jgi:protein-disulfide isomerase
VGAKATLVEFGDFQCPACGAYEPLVRKVLADHKDTLAVVFRHFPLTQIHQNALLAAKASEAAGLQGKFWEMHDMLYDKQGEWSATLNARDFMISYAKVLKLDTQKFSTDLGSDAIEKKVLAEYQEGVKLGLMGTPTFFLNGKQLTDIKSAQDFEQAVANVTK